jgi:fructose-specific phosphotransferase system IIA component
MLLIVMHKEKEFLNSVMNILRENGLVDATFIQKRWLGKTLFGEHLDSFYSHGQLKDDFDIALVSAISDEAKLRDLIDLIDRESRDTSKTFEDEAFVCTVPFGWIQDLKLESSRTKPRAQEILISECLMLDRINLDLKAKTKEEAITELAESLKTHSAVSDYETFLKDVFNREKVGTTGIGLGIAIPHARTDAVDRFVIAFGRSESGVPFGAPDGKPAKLIFLMGAVKKEVNNYLKILARLTRVLRKESFRERLLKAESPEQVLEAFCKIEGASD